MDRCQDEFSNRIEELLDNWQQLKDAMDDRRAKLLASERAQQYFFDAGEAESWMSEQELYMMVEDRGKDEISAQNLMKKHQTLELAVDDYAETIRQLGETARQLITEGIPFDSIFNQVQLKLALGPHWDFIKKMIIKIIIL